MWFVLPEAEYHQEAQTCCELGVLKKPMENIGLMFIWFSVLCSYTPKTRKTGGDPLFGCDLKSC